MGKLVPDKIPDIFEASGRTARVTTLATGPYQAAVHDKLRASHGSRGGRIILLRL